jgi:asparagine synthase (glutamine-hydrolysing)
MCGITGVWETRRDAWDLTGMVNRMARALTHRGPDDHGTWVDEGAGVALGHRRLSILDLSSAGHQPMVSACGRYLLVFNGEIYNHDELRRTLQRELEKLPVQQGTIARSGEPSPWGYRQPSVERNSFWQGHSDTEVLLAALAHWGVERALARLNGMFAFALWDRADRQLFLARDRLGEKPLYYGRFDGAFVFASELKALRAHPGWRGEVDRKALTLYLRYNYVPTPYSIYRGIRKLPPAHYVVVSKGGLEVSDPMAFWEVRALAERGVRDPFRDDIGLVDALEQHLREAIALRMEADVPLGAFLSGGIDSSTVVALMQAQSSRPVKTFSIGFHEGDYNEAKHAAAVARHLGTEHTDLYVTPQEALAVVPLLPEIWDEPFGDSSQVPTYLLSKLTRRHVTVALSGDGGDELFGGYYRYLLGERLWRWMKPLPRSLRRALAAGVRQVPVVSLTAINNLLPSRYRVLQLPDRLPKVAQVLDATDPEGLYGRLVSYWSQPDRVVIGADEPQTLLIDASLPPEMPSFLDRMMYLDQLTYLPDDILTKVDRASMAVSLEARVPFLDHRLVEFAWRVPLKAKVRNGQGKWVLRQVLYRYVPPELVERVKQGFGLPIEHWLRSPLRDWAAMLLDERRLREEGFFDPAPIRRLWDEHVSGKRRWHYQLWGILMFEAWLAAQSNWSGDG